MRRKRETGEREWEGGEREGRERERRERGREGEERGRGERGLAVSTTLERAHTHTLSNKEPSDSLTPISSPFYRKSVWN